MLQLIQSLQNLVPFFLNLPHYQQFEQIRKIAEITSYNFYILLKDTIRSLVINHKYFFIFYYFLFTSKKCNLFFITKDVNFGFYFSGNLGMLKTFSFQRQTGKPWLLQCIMYNFFKLFL